MTKQMFIVTAVILMLFLAACGNVNVAEPGEAGEAIAAVEAGDYTENYIEGRTSEEEAQDEYAAGDDAANLERALNWVQDLEQFRDFFPTRHINAFSVITEDEFNYLVDELIAAVSYLDDVQVITRLRRIFSAIGDSHSNIGGLGTANIDYPMNLRLPLFLHIFDDGLYVVNATEKYKDVIHAKVAAIGGHDVDYVLRQVRTIVPSENDYWAKARMPVFIMRHIYLYGLGILPDMDYAHFTVVKDGEVTEIIIEAIDTPHNEIVWYNLFRENCIVARNYELFYHFEFLEDYGALILNYNLCRDIIGGPAFAAFNHRMFEYVADKELRKIIVDLRVNTGGNAEIFNSFTNELRQRADEFKDVEIYVLVGRDTYSAAMFAISGILNAAPYAVTVGERIGGALQRYGNIDVFRLSNTDISVSFSRDFWDFTASPLSNDLGVNAFIPEIEIPFTIDDFIAGRDPVLDYVLGRG